MGRAHCIALAARGAHVVVVDTDESAALGVVEEIGAAGATATAIRVSGAASELTAVAVRTLDLTGRIDVVVNNAGIAHDRDFARESVADLERLLEVHIRSPFHLVRAAWNELVSRRGRVVNVVSNAALFGKSGMTSYAASKGALVSWTRALAHDGHPVGVRVNAVAPIAATRLTDGLLGDLTDRLTPDHVASVVVWLAHRDCTETGLVISSAGGAVARVVTARMPVGVGATPEDVRDLLGTQPELSHATLPTSAAAEVGDVRADLANLSSNQTNPEGQPWT